jgi:hypothetical protein
MSFQSIRLPSPQAEEGARFEYLRERAEIGIFTLESIAGKNEKL